MTSAERTSILTTLGSRIAEELRKLNPARPWTVVEPTEDTYAVYLRNAGQARIYLHFEGYGSTEGQRLVVSGWQHIGKNSQYVEVYERCPVGSGWYRQNAPSITVSVKRGPEAIAKDISKRFLPEYLRIFALAEAKVTTDLAYARTLVDNLLRLAKVAGVTVPTDNTWRGEQRKYFSLHIGNSYHTVQANEKDADLKLSSLTFEQAEHIIRYLKQTPRH